MSLLFFQFPTKDERPRDLESSHKFVVLSNTLLPVLAGVTQSSFSEVEEGPLKTSQKAKKYAKRTRRPTKSIDVTPFRALNLEIPTTRDEAKGMALEILTKQKRILVVCS
jgi:hypothetical protein